MIRSYAAGFIFTTSLPPTVLAGSLAAVRILKGDEGRQLRARQQDNVAYLKHILTQNGLPQLPSVSHIIPVPVNGAEKCTHISNQLLNSYDQYVQSINYPTVAKGEERLRLAPTPFHTRPMMNQFVEQLKTVWQSVGLPLHSSKLPETETSWLQHDSCYFCHRSIEAIDQQSVPCKCNVGCPQLIRLAA